MAISTQEITAIISNRFETTERFGKIIALLGGISERLELEIQRDAALREASEFRQQTQFVSQSKQSELEKAIAELNAKADAKQQVAQQYQAQIDAINAQLPDLLG